MVYTRLIGSRSSDKPLFALLIDPDRTDGIRLDTTLKAARAAGVDLLLVGSSILLEKGAEETVNAIKSVCDIPVVLFPGSNLQLTPHADALLFLSLISGRNPDLLIGQHVQAAPIVRRLGIETIPTGYLLIDSGHPTAATYMSQSAPIPHDKDDIAAATAMAGELLGLKAIYLDAGSGARHPVRASMIRKVRASVGVPIIVGGGIRTPEHVAAACAGGADVVVVGNSVEQETDVLFDLVAATRMAARS
ncbi:MAG: geranylgeranylglyceryl/heptaprenylglyceryl phosphate synthase [Bacteroidota bacterium]